MNRIAVDTYIGPVWYDSFADVVANFSPGGELYLYINDVVRFNVCYRDYLRAHGIDALIDLLCEQAPAFRKETAAIHTLRQKVKKLGPLADYDIQCLSTEDSFTILGHSFNGIEDVCHSVTRYHRCERYDFEEENHDKLNDIHILCDYEPYPIFDGFDLSDDRKYCNYFFLPRQFTEDDIARIDAMPTFGNNSKVSERLEHISEMPLLYYRGDGLSMLLVTPK